MKKKKDNSEDIWLNFKRKVKTPEELEEERIDLLRNSVKDDSEENKIDMSNMFSGATIFNQSISSWDVSKVTSVASLGITNLEDEVGQYDKTLTTNYNGIDAMKEFKSAIMNHFNQNKSK
jgi:hypothetical protein